MVARVKPDLISRSTPCKYKGRLYDRLGKNKFSWAPIFARMLGTYVKGDLEIKNTLVNDTRVLVPWVWKKLPPFELHSSLSPVIDLLALTILGAVNENTLDDYHWQTLSVTREKLWTDHYHASEMNTSRVFDSASEGFRSWSKISTKRSKRLISKITRNFQVALKIFFCLVTSGHSSI